MQDYFELINKKRIIKDDKQVIDLSTPVVNRYDTTSHHHHHHHQYNGTGYFSLSEDDGLNNKLSLASQIAFKKRFYGLNIASNLNNSPRGSFSFNDNSNYSSTNLTKMAYDLMSMFENSKPKNINIAANQLDFGLLPDSTINEKPIISVQDSDNGKCYGDQFVEVPKYTTFPESLLMKDDDDDNDNDIGLAEFDWIIMPDTDFKKDLELSVCKYNPKDSVSKGSICSSGDKPMEKLQEEVVKNKENFVPIIVTESEKDKPLITPGMFAGIDDMFKTFIQNNDKINVPVPIKPIAQLPTSGYRVWADLYAGLNDKLYQDYDVISSRGKDIVKFIGDLHNNVDDLWTSWFNLRSFYWQQFISAMSKFPVVCSPQFTMVQRMFYDFLKIFKVSPAEKKSICVVEFCKLRGLASNEILHTTVIYWFKFYHEIPNFPLIINEDFFLLFQNNSSSYSKLTPLQMLMSNDITFQEDGSCSFEKKNNSNASTCHSEGNHKVLGNTLKNTLIQASSSSNSVSAPNGVRKRNVCMSCCFSYFPKPSSIKMINLHASHTSGIIEVKTSDICDSNIEFCLLNLIKTQFLQMCKADKGFKPIIEFMKRDANSGIKCYGGCGSCLTLARFTLNCEFDKIKFKSVVIEYICLNYNNKTYYSNCLLSRIVGAIKQSLHITF